MIVDTYDEENLKIVFESSQKISDLVKTLPSRTFIRTEGVWKFPVIDYFILKKIFKENGLNLSITERARKQYVDLIDGFRKIKELADQTDVERIALGIKDGMALYPFQKVGAQFLDTLGSGLLGMDMGLGKTFTSISHASNRIKTSPAEMRILVVCPASLKYEWAYQLAKFTDYSYTVIGSGKERL